MDSESFMNNPRFPHTCIITRVTDYPDGKPSDIKTLYDGPCRSYTQFSASTAGDVISSRRALAIPMKRDEWETTPDTGDLVTVNIADREEYGRVIDPSNPNNFGTNILWDYVRN